MEASKKPVPKPAVLWRKVLDGEAILVDEDTDTTLILKNPTAVFVWQLVDGQRTVQEIISALQHECPDAPVTAADDVAEFLAFLMDKGFVLQG